MTSRKDGWKHKTGRNDPCPCGSGKKYKRCHGGPTREALELSEVNIPAMMERLLAEAQAKRDQFKQVHGQGREIISAEYKDSRVVAVGRELHFMPKAQHKCFPDFLNTYLRTVLGTKWGRNQLAKPLAERHQILKWHDDMCAFQASQKPDSDGIYRVEACNAMLAWTRLAYDLYLIKHNANLQRRLLQRLKDRNQFQGARFELAVTAAMVNAGFEINYEDEKDGSKTHPEFLARHPSGMQLAVEAKSRHRPGVLGFGGPRHGDVPSASPRVAAGPLLSKALAKEAAVPYLIFIEVNLPKEQEIQYGSPAFLELQSTVEEAEKTFPPGQFPANAIYFCNDPTYYEPRDVIGGANFWCYEVPARSPRYRLPEQRMTASIAGAMMKRVEVPNEFPETYYVGHSSVYIRSERQAA